MLNRAMNAKNDLINDLTHKKNEIIRQTHIDQQNLISNVKKVVSGVAHDLVDLPQADVKNYKVSLMGFGLSALLSLTACLEGSSITKNVALFATALFAFSASNQYGFRNMCRHSMGLFANKVTPAQAAELNTAIHEREERKKLNEEIHQFKKPN